MTINPVAHDANGVEVYDDRKDHGGVVPWSAVRFGSSPIPREFDRAVLVLSCPVAGCGGETAHPVHDAAPELVREVAAGLATRVPEGPRPDTPQEQQEATDKGARALRLTKLDTDIRDFATLTAAERAAATLNGLIILRAVTRRLLGE